MVTINKKLISSIDRQELEERYSRLLQKINELIIVTAQEGLNAQEHSSFTLEQKEVLDECLKHFYECLCAVGEEHIDFVESSLIVEEEAN